MDSINEFRKQLTESYSDSMDALRKEDFLTAYQKMEEAGEIAKKLTDLTAGSQDSLEYAALAQEYLAMASRLRALAQQNQKHNIPPKQKPAKSFSEFLGLDNLKEYLRKDVIVPWKNHDMKSRKLANLFVYGPTGVAKTNFVQSLIKELGAYAYYFQPFQNYRLEDLVDISAQMRKIFDDAEKRDNTLLVFDKPLPFFPAGDDENREATAELFTRLVKAETARVKRKNLNILFVATTSVPDTLTKKIFQKNGFNDLIRIHRPNSKLRKEIILEETEGCSFDPKEAIYYFVTRTKDYVTSDVSKACRILMENKEPGDTLTEKEIDAALKQFTPWLDEKYEGNVDGFEKSLKGVEIHES